MNIAQALKSKNRILGEMNKLFSFIERHNITSKKVGTDRPLRDGSVTPESVLEAFQNYLSLGEKLVEAKSAIQLASAPIAPKLVGLAEAKSLLSRVNTISVKEAVKVEGGFGKESYEIEYSSAITEKAQIAIAEELQNSINELQDEIDAFNATTQV